MKPIGTIATMLDLSGTLAGDHPQLKRLAMGDLIDSNGPCGESSTGKDQVREQKIEDSIMRVLQFDN